MSLPASAASTLIVACQWAGVAISTASMSRRASTSRKSTYAAQARYVAAPARSAVCSSTRRQADSRRLRRTSQMASTCTSARPANPPTT